MKYIFFGSPEFASTILKELISAGYPPLAVICNPDKPVGRKHLITAPLTKSLATDYNQKLVNNASKIEILQPGSTKNLKALTGKLSAINPDFAIVAAYAKIIPEEIIKIPRLGTIGVHPSLLPKYRGASPIQSVLLAGEEETGVCLYQMDKEMDHGDIIAKKTLQIESSETFETLRDKLAALSAELLTKTIPDFVSGKIQPLKQDHSAATFTKKFETADGEVDMKKDKPESIYRKIKALNPDPGVFTMNFPGREGVRVKLLDAQLTEGELKITEIQPAGKKTIRLSR